MLRNGQFIKETRVVKVAPYDTGKVKIGEFYVPKVKEDQRTPEERFAQSVVLGYRDKGVSFFSRVLGLMLRI